MVLLGKGEFLQQTVCMSWKSYVRSLVPSSALSDSDLTGQPQEKPQKSLVVFEENVWVSSWCWCQLEKY